MTSYKPVTAVLRGFEVLASVSRLYGKATVAEIHRQTLIDKSTIVRMLETLVSAGYVVRDPEMPVYSVTGKTLMLSASFDRHKVFGDIVAEPLRSFRETIGWPSDIALFDHDAMLVIESSRMAGPLSFNRAPGYRAPVLGTSLGLAYIANCGEAERRKTYETLKDMPGPWNEIAHDPSALEEKLAKVREAGFATMEPSYSAQEYSKRIFSIGVPIMTEGTVFASINVIYLRTAMSKEKAKDEIFPKLKSVAESLAIELASRSS